MGLDLGPISRFHTRYLYESLKSRYSWIDRLVLDKRANKEIEFWLSNIELYNGHSIWARPAAMRVVYSNASDMGYGGLVEDHGPHVAHGQWSDVEAKQSSTWGELKAVSRVLSAVVSNLTNCRVK